ncbi:MAG: response regulator [Mucilaginibacter sp.]|nr:response regulator [Mucilaginibacter sp.]
MLKKILILDDNEDILEVINDVLSEEGYETECLSYTNDIYASINAIQPDLVILDYILFGINGGELCHQVKNNPATAHIPVIMISAYSRVLASLGSYGADVFIAKPFLLEDLVNGVRNCLLNAGNVNRVMSAQ